MRSTRYKTAIRAAASGKRVLPSAALQGLVSSDWRDQKPRVPCSYVFDRRQSALFEVRFVKSGVVLVVVWLEVRPTCKYK